MVDSLTEITAKIAYKVVNCLIARSVFPEVMISLNLVDHNLEVGRRRLLNRYLLMIMVFRMLVTL